MKLSIVLPTYNEAENIEKIIAEILNLKLDAQVQIIVVDDNSPDGTGDIVQKMIEKLSSVNVIEGRKVAYHPPQEVKLIKRRVRGRGSAGKEGMKYALSCGADYVMEMDADFSHPPRFIPDFLKEAEKGYDLIIGSRYLPGSKEIGRSLLRKIISWLSNLYISLLLKLSVKDCTSGFRLFSAELLKKIDWDKIISEGPSLVQELLYEAKIVGAKIKEIPIDFEERKKGKSKLRMKTLINSLIQVWRIKKKF